MNDALIDRSPPFPRILGKLLDERPVDHNIGERENLFDARIAARDHLLECIPGIECHMLPAPFEHPI